MSYIKHALGAYFIHEDHLCKAARAFRKERLEVLYYDHCYPRFPVLAYTVLTDALMNPKENMTEDLKRQLIAIWAVINADPMFEENMAMVKQNVSICFPWLLHFFC